MNTPAGRLMGDTCFCVICQAASISRIGNHASFAHDAEAISARDYASYAHDTDTITAGELPHRLPGHTYYYNLNMSYLIPSCTPSCAY